MNLLQGEHITVRYGDYTVLDDISFSLHEGQWLMVIGPNGAGKSTLLKAISRACPMTGKVSFLGADLHRMRYREAARHIGVLEQNHSVGYSFSVEEVVRLGRYAYGSAAENECAVDEALALTGLEPLRKHSVLTLSGGELQRTFLAQLFAQDPDILMLDEPTNHLDLLYQKQVFTLVKEWLKTSGRAVISVVHDLSLARSFGTDALLLNAGRILSSGSIEEVFKSRHLEEAYRMDVYAWMREMLSQWNAEEVIS